jgi:hypothetical protein
VIVATPVGHGGDEIGRLIDRVLATRVDALDVVAGPKSGHISRVAVIAFVQLVEADHHPIRLELVQRVVDVDEQVLAHDFRNVQCFQPR